MRGIASHWFFSPQDNCAAHHVQHIFSRLALNLVISFSEFFVVLCLRESLWFLETSGDIPVHPAPDGSIQIHTHLMKEEFVLRRTTNQNCLQTQLQLGGKDF